ncbi:O-methyltransferase, family 2 [Corchorus olitorius]|uniref:O-methyltransferase, family 2 n=1 Tax=Corchorus olitorius TaxID=93759 RepID=A0A1R3IIG7_9ROSI|nr:O-methyltransferase, family 2 [Corchorus olitorius]
MASSKEVALEEDHTETFAFAIELVMASVLPMALKTAVEIGLLEIMAKAGPGAKLSASDIAARMPTENQAAPVMVDRIARLLASHDVLCCSVVGLERLYSLSPVAYYFVPNQDGVSLGPYLALAQDKILLDSWFHLKDAILEGGVAFHRAHGTNVFECGGIDARFNQVFNTAMFDVSTIVTKRIMECYKGFEGIQQLVDVGGNQGITLHYIISKYPNLKGINFDLPHVIHHAPSYPGVEHAAGDMFESVPQGDAIFMKMILHDWGDEQSLRLLNNCFKAIPDNGKVIIVDSIIPDMPLTSHSDKAQFLADIVMMTLNQGGKERTKQEFMALATQAGFKRVNFECSVCDIAWVMEFYKT